MRPANARDGARPGHGVRDRAVSPATPIPATFEWDLPAGYRYQVTRFGSIVAEVVRDSAGDHVREETTCWGGTSPAESDDTLEPRLELQEWNAPPASAMAWRIGYSPAEPQPDGSTLVRWDGLRRLDGEAVDRSRRAAAARPDRGPRPSLWRTGWRTVEIAFTGFPAAITPVRPEPPC